MEQVKVKVKELNRQYLMIQGQLLQAKYPNSVAKVIFKLDKQFLLEEDCKEGATENCRFKVRQTDVAVYEKELEQVINRAKQDGVVIPLERIATENGLEPAEKELLMLLFFAQFYSRNRIEGRDLLQWISADALEMMENLKLLMPGGRLRKNGLIRVPRGLRYFDDSVVGQEYKISEEVFYEICGVQNEMDSAGVEKDAEMDKEPIVELLTIKEPRVSFDQLALPEPTRRQIEQALWHYKNQDRACNDYGIGEKIVYGNGTTMVFCGPPGTGKTATAEAIARALNKKLGVVDYPRIYSRYVGESEENIKKVFWEAKRVDCVLVFDEADACFGVRVEERGAADRSFNLMTNILMQEVERFKGILILTTNREFAFDPAFDRRFLYKLNFGLPDEKQREQIWRILLKDCAKLNPDVSFGELARWYPLSGGQIKNAVLKAVMRCSAENREITMSDLKTVAAEELGEKAKKRLGF
jgi:ATP-dependent 26S proteasome regulatory subunit